MVSATRLKKNGSASRSNANFFQLSLGMFLGALGMNLWIGSDVDPTALWLDQDRNSISEKKVVTSLKSIPEVKETKGWHSIHVFYGEKEGLFNDAPKSITQSQESFAQVGQDSIILDLLGSNGYFIDLAANDALDLTNTLALERKGWTGLCVEPNHAYWYGLSHRKCTVVGALVSGTKPEPVKVKFRGVYGGIVGKLSAKLANRKKEPDAPKVTRYTAPILEVLQKFDVPKIIDYLSLDVEGSEYDIMKYFPFDSYTIRIMTVERPNKELKALLEEKGYVFLAELAPWGEYLWGHKSSGFTPEHDKIKSIKPRT